MCSGVEPSSAFASLSAPLANKSLTSLPSPSAAARCRGDHCISHRPPSGTILVFFAPRRSQPSSVPKVAGSRNKSLAQVSGDEYRVSIPSQVSKKCRTWP
eukprot:CAMPEP_0173412124 /NCGR_PEP_ID=MMETSP1356-20130122/78759_1 /TAXON_ID=77927 ORGANISM="Hemiselmis virescens, Strain PCC157" /NCGR_SAMPLE_ID=MMETSP1356 /ASSEMBLY_ACC=CAM_ASM_000847 /LENGTH=99 /DNA_ID=CAMNT_0014373977 /DNA_START=231 /DNA_END=527 /DNA_ORIENTATION=+